MDGGNSRRNLILSHEAPYIYKDKLRDEDWKSEWLESAGIGNLRRNLVLSHEAPYIHIEAYRPVRTS